MSRKYSTTGTNNAYKILNLAAHTIPAFGKQMQELLHYIESVFDFMQTDDMQKA